MTTPVPIPVFVFFHTPVYDLLYEKAELLRQQAIVTSYSNVIKFIFSATLFCSNQNI